MPRIIHTQDYGSPKPGVKRMLYVLEEADKRVGIFIDFPAQERAGREPPRETIRALEQAERGTRASFIARLGAALQKES